MKNPIFALLISATFLSQPILAQCANGTDCQNGQGTMVYPSGHTYSGMFFKGLKHGHGIYIYPEGRKLIGSFLNDRITGKEMFYVAMPGQTKDTKDIKYKYLYEGDMVNGQMTGWGKLVNFVDETKYEGAFIDDYPNGFGTFNYKDESIYTGTLKNGYRQGYGLNKYPDGSVYLGSWDNNVRSGNGTLIDPKSEKQIHGIWANDVQRSVTAIAPSTR